MCGRYTLTALDEQLIEEYGLIIGGHTQPRYNIAPTQQVPVVRMIEGIRRMDPLRWGLVPYWAKDLKMGSRMINARSEEVAGKPAFRNPLRRQRCLVPCTGFFEWKPIADKEPGTLRKQPYHIRRRDGRVFSLAGLWDHWQNPEGTTIESYTILTTSANPLLSSLHDRMPVIIGRENYDLWLDPAMQDATRLQPLLVSSSDQGFEAVAVNSRVNSPLFDDPTCIQAA